MKVTPIAALLGAFLTLLMTGCGHSGNNKSASSTGSGDSGASGLALGRFLLRDEAADDLYSFSAEVSALRLVSADGSLSDSVIAGPLRVEFLSLSERSRWVALTGFEPGDYSAMQLEFKAFSYLAQDQMGNPVDIVATSDVLFAPLTSTMTAEGNEDVTVVVELDLSASLSGDVESGTLQFDPTGFTVEGGLEQVEDLVGLVTNRETGPQLVLLELYADGDRTVPLGTAEVFLPRTAVMLDQSGFQLLEPSYFLTYLTPGSTLVELGLAFLSPGTLRASKLEITGQAGVDFSDYAVELAGRIVESNGSDSYRVQIRKIVAGAEFAEPALIVQDDTSFIDVLVDDSAVIVLDNRVLIDLFSLLVGDEVELKFQNFAANLFQAQRVDVLLPEGEDGVVDPEDG